MKIQNLILAMVCASALAIFVAPIRAQAAAPASAAVTAPAAVATPAPAPAPAVAAPAVAASTTSWIVSFFTNPTSLGWLLATGAAVFSVFQVNSTAAATAKLTNTQLMLRATIVGVEHATQLPQVRAVEQDIKGAIQKFATANGVQADLDTLVQNVVSGFATPATPAASPAATPPPAPAA
jgi:hypothetical protein